MRSMAKVRITAIPPGEAPEHIRAAWIGLELPLAAAAPRALHVSGVRSGPGSRLGAWLGLATGAVRESSGWVVKVGDALTVLERADPAAAAWWRTNVPRMFDDDRTFVFATACGQAVDDGVPAPASRLPARHAPLALLLGLMALGLLPAAGIATAWAMGRVGTVSPLLWIVIGLGLLHAVRCLLLVLARLRALAAADQERG